jgi:hypothetical protein
MLRNIQRSVIAILVIVRLPLSAQIDAAVDGALPEVQGSMEVAAHQDTMVSSELLPPVEGATGGAGFYPTAADLQLLGDQDYPRQGSRNQSGPDRRLQNAMDVFPYESGEQDFYSRNRGVFDPLNRVLGVFTPHKAFTVELPDAPLAGMTLDAGLPIFTRTLEPRNSHVKVGPLAFDLLWIGGGALWSDYDGPRTFREGAEDGWIGYIDLALRGYAQITDSIFFALAANVIYLPGTNEVGLRIMNGSRPTAVAELFYQKRIGTWDLLLTDRFYAVPGMRLFADLNDPGSDRAGRYQFGYAEREDRTGFYDANRVRFSNHIAGSASTMVGLSDWRFRGDLDHFDFWQSFDFENHRRRDTIGLSMGYEGNDIPFSPLISYRASSFDGLESFLHRVQLLLAGRITENISATAGAGYLWSSGYEPNRSRGLWRLGLRHRFSQRGSHGFTAGQRLLEDPFSPEVLLTTYYRYFVGYQLATRLNVSAYAQHTDGERLVSGEPGVDTGDVNFYTVGVTAAFQPFDFTRIIGSVAYRHGDGEFNRTTTDRWLYRLQLTQRLVSRLTLETLYQYEDFEGRSSFDEHLVSMSLRWYF